MSEPAEEHASEGAPEWMVSYADMITILMSFFVVMFSMAGQKDGKREEPVMQSLRRQFGRFVGMPAGQLVPRDSAMSNKSMAVKMLPQKETKNRGLVGDHPRVTTIRPGDQATIGGVIYFASGESECRAIRIVCADTLVNSEPHHPKRQDHLGSFFTF